MKKYLLFSLVMIFFFVSCDSNSHKAQVKESINTNSLITSKNDTSYMLTTIEGEKISLEVSKVFLGSNKYKGKMVLLNFWAPWCKPCVKEMPMFVKLQEKFKNDLIIIGVLFDKKSSLIEVKDFIKKYEINFPVTIGIENERLAQKLDDVKMIPESFLYNKEGLFLEKFVGEVSKTKMEEYLKNN